MGFTRFVQNGRVALVNFGADTGKLVTIVDVIDQNRCVVYGPSSGVPRQVMGYKRLNLTDIKIELGRGCKAKTVEAARKAKASANDFDRFKAMCAHKKLMVRTRKALK